EIAAVPPLRERLNQRREVLARLDRADVEDDSFREAIASAHARDRGGIADRAKLRRRGCIDDVHAPGIEMIEANDVALDALRDGGGGVGGAPRVGRGGGRPAVRGDHSGGGGGAPAAADGSAARGAGSCRES